MNVALCSGAEHPPLRKVAVCDEPRLGKSRFLTWSANTRTRQAPRPPEDASRNDPAALRNPASAQPGDSKRAIHGRISTAHAACGHPHFSVSACTRRCFSSSLRAPAMAVGLGYSQQCGASGTKAWPNRPLQPKVNGLPPLGLHFILAQSRQPVAFG